MAQKEIVYRGRVDMEDVILVAFAEHCARHNADFEVCDYLTCRLARAIELNCETDYKAVMLDAVQGKV